MPLPKLLVTGILMAANMALTMTRKIEGPRLDDLKFTSGDYGAAIPLVWGKRRLQTPIFWAEDLREVKQQRKTKGGKFNEYTYFGTWAVALADHEIAGVTRIWFDTHLVFDLTGVGPVTPFDFTGSEDGGGKLGNTAGDGAGFSADNMAIYYGTEAQGVDPRMEATVEAAQGEGSCPAYKGLSYIVFKDVPLEKLGNRIPQVAVEVATSTSGSIPTEAKAYTYDPGSSAFMVLSPDCSRGAWMNGGTYEIWDMAARAPMIAGDSGGGGLPSSGSFGVFNDGTMMFADGYIYSLSPEGVQTLVLSVPSSDYYQYSVTVLSDGEGVEHWGTHPFSFYEKFYFDGVLFEPGWQACCYARDGYGNVWVAGREVAAGSTTTTVYFQRLVTVDNTPGFLTEFALTMPVAAGPTSNGVGPKFCASGDSLLLWWEGALYLVDPLAGTVGSATASGFSFSGDAQNNRWNSLVRGTTTIWLGNKEVDITTGTVIRTEASIPTGSYRSIYDPINHALVLAEPASDQLVWYYLDRIDGDGVTLEDVATDLATRVGATDVDFSDLDQTIEGWSATQGQASNMLEPLLDAYDSDIAPHDFTIRGKKRGGTASGILETEYFAKGTARYTVKVRQAAELPRALTYSYADINADQQPNNVRADRPLDASGAYDERTIDLSTFASTPDTMRGLADRHFRRMWNERKTVDFALTAQELAVEPTDLKTLDLDGEQWTARCVKTTIKASGEIATEWVYDTPSLNVLGSFAGAAFDGRNPSTIMVPLPSKGFVLDIPLIRDVDNTANPLVYIAASPYAAGAWPGASAFQAVDGEYSEEIGAVPSSAPATWGYANTALSNASANVWDRGSSVNVTLQVGSLTGCTEAAVDANPLLNLCLIGDELVNFTTATLEGDGSYTLSGFKRGRRGTEWATGTHAARDVFLLLASPETGEMGLSEVSTALSFKVVTTGRTATGAFPIDFTFTGASLKPYAPANVSAVKSGSDWIIYGTRRTRVGGAWTGGGTIPLSEASEEYEIDLSDGVTDVTKTVTSLPYTWTAATQTTDMGGVVAEGDLTGEIFQMSDAVGRGFGTTFAG